MAILTTTLKERFEFMVPGKLGGGTVVIPPNCSVPMGDEVWAHFRKRQDIVKMLDLGQLFEGEAAAAAPRIGQAREEVTTQLNRAQLMKLSKPKLIDAATIAEAEFDEDATKSEIVAAMQTRADLG